MLDGQLLEEPEHHVENQCQEPCGRSHCPSEYCCLGVVTGSVGHSCVREGWLLAMRHSHVVRVCRCEQDNCEVEVDHVIDFECTHHSSALVHTRLGSLTAVRAIIYHQMIIQKGTQ